MHVQELLKVSRPRFWIYLIGPALLGSAAALTSGGQWSCLSAVALLVFTLPGNLFLYGVNDIFDQETDRRNPKKQGYESLLDVRSIKWLLWAITLSLTPAIPLFLFLPHRAIIGLLIFLCLGLFYSAPPIRAKAIPFLDSLFNVLYLVPGFVAWYAFGGGPVNWIYLIAGAAWCMAMHAYSAIPDIESDRLAKLQTIATTLGKGRTLLVCGALYTLAALLLAPIWRTFPLICGLVYILLILQSARARSANELFVLYKAFPWVNTMVGGLWFCAIILSSHLH